MSYEPANSPLGNATIVETTTNLTLGPLTVNVLKGTKTTFTGKLTDVNGAGITGKDVHFYVDDIDTEITAITDANGWYTFEYTWDTAGAFSYQTKYLGD